MAQEQGVDIAEVAESGTMVLVAVMVGTATQCVSKVLQTKSTKKRGKELEIIFFKGYTLSVSKVYRNLFWTA